MVLVVVLGVSSRLVSNMIMDSASIVILVMILESFPGVTLIACSISSWIWISILSLILIRV